MNNERENIAKALQTACLLADDLLQLIKQRNARPEPPEGRSPDHYAMIAYLGIIAEEARSVVNKIARIA